MAGNDAAKVRLVDTKSQEQLERGLRNLMGIRPESETVREIPRSEVSAPSSESTISGTAPSEQEGLTSIDIEKIQTNALPLREEISEDELRGLAESIQSRGIIQPIVVRPISGEQHFEIIAGQRRFEAAKLAGLSSIPAIISDYSDQQALEVAIIENAQRLDLNPIEEANSFKRLVEEFGLTQTTIASTVGKSRVTISNALRLLQLDIEIIDLIKQGQLSAGHARALLGIKDETLRLEIARRVVREGWSVRNVEEAAQAIMDIDEAEEEVSDEEIESDEQLKLSRLRDRVEKYLGLGVSLNVDQQGRKRLQITFPTEAAWKRFVSKIRT